MARTTVRIVLPSANADQTIKLLETILAEHARRETATPGSSPLKSSVITAIQALIGPAKADRLKSQELAAQAAALLEKSNKALGLAEGQNLRTEDTGLFYAAQVRDTLVAELRGKENEIETFGFKVVVGSAASPTRKPKA
ncbi:MAG: hypothetical protein WC661_11005 [Opitutaceae bacterium]|jgi:hypothetical protein